VQPIPLNRVRPGALYVAAEEVCDADRLVSQRSLRSCDARPSVMLQCMSCRFTRRDVTWVGALEGLALMVQVQI